MVEEVIWSPLAVETYDRPGMFRLTGQRPNTYITSINKKTTLTYRYKPSKKQVELVVFWGMQNPATKPGKPRHSLPSRRKEYIIDLLDEQ